MEDYFSLDIEVVRKFSETNTISIMEEKCIRIILNKNGFIECSVEITKEILKEILEQ